MRYILVLLITALINIVNAQEKYWVSYKDKAASNFSIENPEAFMSKNALARRTKHHIKISDTDIPVCKAYTNTISALGVEVNKSSNWLNGSLVYIADNSKVSLIEGLEFVKSIQGLSITKTKIAKNKFNLISTRINKTEYDYGDGLNQIKMLAGNSLHDLDFRGKGIEIAIMDNGFPNVNTNRFYQKAYQEGRIRVGYDFVNDNDTVFDNTNGNHGNYVISTMVSDIKEEMIGTAPDATYYLFSTEDNYNEGLPEEYNWAMAAEMADSLMGENAIISTSLGYSNDFDIDSTSHTYQDMDGNTTPITIAADLAAAKGFLVINSAGNSGSDPWHYITAPSDGDSVLCIGAVGPNRDLAAFSSRGPAFDGDVKPNVCAQGLAAVGINAFGQIVRINGTSFSCPITAGMAACLWQAFPEKSNMEIFYAIEKSAHLFSNPNDDYGYGIPNFKLSYLYLLNTNIPENEMVIFPNPVTNAINFILKNKDLDTEYKAEIYNLNGELMKSQFFTKNEALNIYIFEDVSMLSSGTYFLSIRTKKDNFQSKFIKK
tara:strand:+ start:116 stop:1747 length:1632 start_codon:yes stop_codon:yes gene_type:complete